MKKENSKSQKIKDLKKEKRILQIKANVTETLLKLGIKVEYAFPFILSAIIAITIHNTTMPSYIIDENFSLSKSSQSAQEENSKTFIYSTPWQYNDQLSLERKEITFILKDDINLEEVEQILRMTPEELKKAFKVHKVKTIKPLNNKDIDSTFEKEMVIIPSMMLGEENKLIRSETRKEISSRLLLYLTYSFLIGLVFKNLEDALTHTYVRDQLKEKLSNIEESHSEEIKSLNDMIKEEMRTENIPEKKINFRKKYNNI